MNTPERFRQRSEIQKLIQLATDLHYQGKSYTAENLLEQALTLSDQGGDIPLQVQTRYCLAAVQSEQKKNIEALQHCSWLISLSNDPAYTDQLDDDSFFYIAHAYVISTIVGQRLPHVPITNLFSIVKEGMDWLEWINKPHWAVDFRLVKSALLLKRAMTDEAKQETEAALALSLRNADKQDILWCKGTLAGILVQDQSTRHEALLLLEELQQADLSIRQTFDVNVLLGLYYLLEKDLERAYSFAQRNVDLSTEFESAHYQFEAYTDRGDIYDLMKYYEGALADYNYAFSLVPDDKQSLTAIHISRGMIYSQMECYELALSEMDQALALMPDNKNADPRKAWGFYKRGTLYQLMERHSEALVDLDQAIALEPKALYFMQRSTIYQLMGRYAEALVDLDQAIALEPDATYFMGRGAINVLLENYPAALADMSQAIALEPVPEAFFSRAAIYQVMEQYGQALLDLNQAIALNPEATWFVARSVTNTLLENYQAAVADMSQAISLGSQDVQIFSERGSIYYLLENYQAALADFTQAISLAPHDAQAFMNRGAVYRTLEDYQYALADFTQAISLDPGLALTFASRGNVYRLLGNYQEALNDLSHAIKLDPADDWNFYRRAQIYWCLGQQRKVAKDLQKAISLFRKKDYSNRDEFSFALYTLFAGDAPKAYEIYKSLIAMHTSRSALKIASIRIEDFAMMNIASEITQKICALLRKRLWELEQTEC